MRKIIIWTFIVSFVIGFFAGLFGVLKADEVTVKESTVKKTLAVASLNGNKLVSVRQVNPNTYEVTTTTSKGVEKKTVSVRQVVGNTYEIKEN